MTSPIFSIVTVARMPRMGRASVDRGAFIADVFDRIPRLRQVPLGHWPALAIRGVILSAPRLRWAPKSFAGS